MTAYSVAEAKNHLPKLLNRALAGEAVVITKRGKPIAEIRPIADRGPPPPEDDDAFYAWLRAGREERGDVGVDIVQFIREMREEGEH